MEKYTIYKTSAFHKGGQSNVKFSLPKTCVHCNEIMTPEVIHKATTEDYCSLLLRCSSCKEFFAASYQIYYDDMEHIYKSDIIPYSYNIKVTYDLPDEIEYFSSDAKDIYIQSLQAEAYNLFHIAGIGYRKTIEFLIKDFLINVNGEDKKIISKLLLGQAIEKIDSENIKTLAKASTWIGNDETHYIRKHPDKDVNDLKMFLKALSQLLSSEYLVKEALSIINENSSNKSN